MLLMVQVDVVGGCMKTEVYYPEQSEVEQL